MFYLACTRFNNETLEENLEYKALIGLNGVIYGTSIQINKKYPLGSLLIVIEMNNELNKIVGLGLIKNKVYVDKKYKIYRNQDYNRYVYKGEYWLSPENFDIEVIKMLENMVFKGCSHLKRQSGISVITKKLFNRWNYDEDNIKTIIRDTFLRYFISISDTI